MAASGWTIDGRRAAATGALALAVSSFACLPPEWGANAILHPWRRPRVLSPPIPHRPLVVNTNGAILQGWVMPGAAPVRGTLVYMHGVADNRQSAIGFAQRYVSRGFDVIAYDSRAHGDSTGDACTYGFYEKHDLLRVLDATGVKAAILFGTSLGGSVALQAAALDPRIRGVVAQAPYADLLSIVADRKPFVATDAEVRDAIRIAETRGRFKAVEVSAAFAARTVRVPVLLIHGERDRDTSPAHSRRIFAALAGPKRLLLVSGAGHNDALAREDTWREVDAFMDRLAPAP